MRAEGVPLRLERLAKRYGPVAAVRDVSLDVPAGAFVTLLGPSGSGKTTVLMMIAGLVEPSSGAVFIGGRDVKTALTMLRMAQKAMVPPFEISAFADPSGAFTTAAAMVACVERVLKFKFGRTWKGTRVAVFGGKGVVGSLAAYRPRGQGG